MPNYCTNTVTVTAPAGLDARAIASELEDFNRIIPMPPEFKQIVSGSYPLPDLDPAKHYGVERVGDRLVARLWWDGKPGRPIDKAEGEALERAHGCVGWYDWAIQNWGTKWGSFRAAGVSGDEKRAKLVFETAWSPPNPVFAALCRKYPGLKIRNRWHEEGGGRGSDEFGQSKSPVFPS